MALRNLSQNDFGYFLQKNKRMIDCHEKEFLQEIEPDLMRALYRGMRRSKKDIIFQGDSGKDLLVTLNRIFTATNTILPNSYNQNPRKMAIAKPGTSEDKAAVLTAVLNHYTKQNHQKEENQEAIMNAWFFGVGWKKIGYHIATESQDKGPENKLSPMDRALLGIKNALGVEPDPTTHKTVPDIVRYENLVSTSENPAHVLVDDDGDLRSYKVITHRLPRTLHDLMVFGRYDNGTIQDIYKKMTHKKGTRFDPRDIHVTLNEMMIEQRNGIWMLTFIDEHPSPLRYEKMAHEGEMPWEPLVLTNEPGVRYPVSHMKVASRVQEWIDNVANLQVDILGKTRNQTYINERILAPGQKNALKRNKLGGIVYGQRAAGPGDIAQIASSGIGQDQFLMIRQFQQNLTEILGSTEQRVSGRSSNDTLGQDKIAEIGGQIRESGMLDAIRTWMINQTRKESQFIQQFHNDSITLEILGKDFADPNLGKILGDSVVEFRTANQPISLRHYLEGSFEHDVNVFEAIRPDNAAIRKELLESISTVSQILPVIKNEGVKVKLGDIVKKYFSSFEAVDLSDVVEELDSEQMAAMQVQQLLQQTGGSLPQTQGAELPQEGAVSE